MKFFTREKKPKLYNALILSVAVLLALILPACAGKPLSAAAVLYLLDGYFVVVFIMFLVAFYRQLQYNPYSYNTIFYFGFSLFILSLIITFFAVGTKVFRAPELYQSWEFLYMLAASAKIYMLLTSPLILFFSVILCISNISLILHEGKRIVNILGILLSVLMVGGEIFLFYADFYYSGSIREIMIHQLLVNSFAAAYLYYECMLIGAFAANIIVVRYKPEPDKDYMIILGCGICGDGTPTPLLRSRIDRALAFCREQEEKTGRAPVLITSGGKGSDEMISESASMKQYLLERGVPEEQILEENRSTSTFENMKFSKELIQERNPEAKIAFATNRYHVFRSGIFARMQKMSAVGIGARTKWYFWPNAAVREFVGLISRHRGKQAAILISMIGVYAVLTVLVYR